MTGEPILLDGGPSETGRRYGDLCAPLLRARIRRMWRAVEASAWSRAQLIERGRLLRRCVKRVAPEWIEEAEALAAAAGVRASGIFALNCLPLGFEMKTVGGCTGCIVLPDASNTGETLLHKNRDESNEPQDFHLRSTSNGATVFASRDIGNLGFAHFHSSSGLAGGNNTGSIVVSDHRRDCALNCCHLLRLVAERAGSCDEAAAVLEDAIAMGVAGGSSPERGMIFLIAGPAGGIAVEMTAGKIAVQETNSGTIVRSNHFITETMKPTIARPPDANTLRRYERARELLEPLPAITTADIARLSRDCSHGPDAICNDDTQHFWMTVSACTHVIAGHGSGRPAVIVTAMGNTRNTLYIPVPLEIDGLPAECVSGGFHQLARRLYARYGLSDRLDAVQLDFEAEAADDLASLADNMQTAPAPERRRAFTECVFKSVAAARRILAGSM